MSLYKQTKWIKAKRTFDDPSFDDKNFLEENFSLVPEFNAEAEVAASSDAEISAPVQQWTTNMVAKPSMSKKKKALIGTGLALAMFLL